jgi:hypothetical protein
MLDPPCCIIHAGPYMLDPTSWTLHAGPYILHHPQAGPYMLDPTCWTLHAASSMLGHSWHVIFAPDRPCITDQLKINSLSLTKRQRLSVSVISHMLINYKESIKWTNEPPNFEHTSLLTFKHESNFIRIKMPCANAYREESLWGTGTNHTIESQLCVHLVLCRFCLPDLSVSPESMVVGWGGPR